MSKIKKINADAMYRLVDCTYKMDSYAGIDRQEGHKDFDIYYDIDDFIYVYYRVDKGQKFGVWQAFFT